MIKHIAAIALAILVTACAVGPTVPAGEPCVAADFTVVDRFDGARRGSCTVLSDNHVRVEIRPEDQGRINDSAWFSFRLEPTQPVTAVVTLRYRGGHHRYWPKTSVDGQHWVPIDAKNVQVSSRGRRATIQIPLGDQPVWLSAQELITPAAYDDWTRAVDEKTVAERSLLGYSKNNRPIQYFDVNLEARDVLFIVGRQHPPEVSGAFAFFSFAETLFSDSELARKFRDRFRIIAIPMLNPDGIVAGHWRHNLGSTDLNRDWGPFIQPETQLIHELLTKLDENGNRIRVFLDFHSTSRNVFYSQDETFVTDPPGFTRAWLARSAARISEYEFTNQENPVSEQANSKNFMYKRYGIPALTYEVGDETDREATRAAARIFAEELMTLLLSRDD